MEILFLNTATHTHKMLELFMLEHEIEDTIQRIVFVSLPIYDILFHSLYHVNPLFYKINRDTCSWITDLGSSSKFKFSPELRLPSICTQSNALIFVCNLFPRPDSIYTDTYWYILWFTTTPAFLFPLYITGSLHQKKKRQTCNVHK